MSPPRRRPPGARPAGTGRRTTALGRRDLEALLSQLDAVVPRSRGRAGTAARGRVDEAELARLRALLADALAQDLALDDEDPEEDEDAWDQDEVDGGDAWDADDDDADDGDEEEDDAYDDAYGPWGGRSSRRGWEDYAPAKPIRVEGGLAARSRRGPIGETWWSKRFLDAIESVMVGGRLGRGRTYARQGQVIDLMVRPGLIEARVQGSRTTPYRVRLAMPVVPDDDWDRIVAALGAQAGYAARMLAGELPHEVEDVFSAEGASLFPAPHARLTTDCTCPDWANPCKHVAAVCYLVAETFDRDPFAVLAWRGRDREAVLAQLRRLRTDRAEASPPVAEAVAPAVTAPPLGECVLGFWKAGPELADVRVRPEAAELPGAVLRHLATGLIEVRGRDVADLLAPAYADLTAAAARRAVGDDVAPTRRQAGE
jgi:uncharacterized Zn finger protein